MKLRYHGHGSAAFWKRVEAVRDVDDEYAILTSLAIALGKMEYSVTRIIEQRQKKISKRKAKKP